MDFREKLKKELRELQEKEPNEETAKEIFEKQVLLGEIDRTWEEGR